MTDTLDEVLRGDELEIEVGEERFTAWEEVEVVRSLDAVSGSFRVRVTPTPGRPWPVRPGDRVSVHVGRDLLLKGHVDAFEGESTATGGRVVTVMGRDQTADLVDCSAPNEPGYWTNRPLVRIVEDLAGRFGIEVVDRTTDAAEPFLVFSLEPGERAWTAIERACRLRAVLAFSEGDGRLVLADASGDGAVDVPLIEGGPTGNVIRSLVRHDHSERFSTYTVRGQHRGEDQGWGEITNRIQGAAVDPEVFRFRPLIVIAEGQVETQDAIARARWEAITRAARGAAVTVEVQGWRQGSPESFLWEINRRAYVELPSWGLEATMLIRAVRFLRDASRGQRTEIALVRTDAYTAAPQVDLDEDPLAGLLRGDDL